MFYPIRITKYPKLHKNVSGVSDSLFIKHKTKPLKQKTLDMSVVTWLILACLLVQETFRQALKKVFFWKTSLPLYIQYGK